MKIGLFSLITILAVLGKSESSYSQITRTQIYNLIGTNSRAINDSWLFENDSLKITYDFWAEGGKLSVTIFNKIDKPIYIDWKKSAFILNSNKINFWTDESNSTSETTLKSRGAMFRLYDGIAVNRNSSVGRSKTNTVKPERITFIPPLSQYDKTTYALLSTDKFRIDGKYITPLKSETLKGDVYYQKEFTYQDSPLKFRNLIAFSLFENSQSSSFVDNEFYLASIRNVSQEALLGKKIYQHPEQSYGIFHYEYPFRKATSFYADVIEY